MSRFILLYLSFISFLTVNAQVSSTQNYWQIKIEREAEGLRIQDSIHRAQDSLRMLWIKSPAANRPNQFIDSLKNAYTVENGDLSIWMKRFGRNTDTLNIAKIKSQRNLWIVSAVGMLVLFFSILRLNYSSQLNTMMQAMYSNAALAQINKEEKFYNRWPFILLYILFGSIFGMFIFLGINTFYSFGTERTISFYLLISLGIILYFSLKIAIVKIFGFIFEVQSLSREYNAILLLSYFNSAIFLLPIVFAFAFLPEIQIEYLFIISSFLLIVFFLLQLVRICYYTLKVHKLSKFYLFLYFCSLEIGPLIILIKSIGL
jgi:hypothetical protein